MLRSYLQSFKSWLTRKPVRKPINRKARLGVESLEKRDVPAGGISPYIRPQDVTYIRPNQGDDQSGVTVNLHPDGTLSVMYDSLFNSVPLPGKFQEVGRSTANEGDTLFALTTSGVLEHVKLDGTNEVENVDGFTDTVKSFLIRNDSSVFDEHSNGFFVNRVYQNFQWNTGIELPNVGGYTVSQDGTLYYLDNTDQNLVQWNGDHFYVMDRGATCFAISSDEKVYDVNGSGYFKRFDGGTGGCTLTLTNIKDFAVNDHGDVTVVTSQNQLLVYNVTGEYNFGFATYLNYRDVLVWDQGKPGNEPSFTTNTANPLNAGGIWELPQGSLVIRAADSAMANAPIALTVSALDVYGNPATGYGGTVEFSSSDQLAGLPANYTFTSADQGSHTFYLFFESVGRQSIVATDTDTNPVTNLGVRQAAIQVTPAAVRFMLSAQGSITAGSPGSVQLTALDANSTVAAGYTGTVSFSSSDQQAGLPANYTFTAADQGNHIFTVTLGTAASQTITATDSAGKISGQATVQVTPAVSYDQVKFTALANNLTHNPEYLTIIIQADYQHYLDRAANDAELPYWLSRIQQGVTDEQIEAGFLGAPEYIYLHGGQGTGWVVGMYQDLLGRTPAQPEVNYWINVLNSGVATQTVAFGFAASDERESQHVSADYQKYLGRSAGQDEITYWVNVFRSGTTNEQVIAGFVGAPEYYQQHGNDTTRWLDAAFQDILSRPPADSEVQTCLNYLSS